MEGLRRRARGAALAIGRHGLVVVVGALAAVVLLGPLSRTTARLGPGTVEVAADPWADRGTTVQVPPLGTVAAPTHRTAIGIDVRLVELDLEALQEEVQDFTGTDAARAEIEAELPGLLRRAATKALALGAVLGGVVALALPARRWWHVPLGAVGALAGVALALGGVARSYDVTAFGEPRFTGALARAPAVFEATRRQVGELGQVQDRVATLSAQLSELFAAAAGPTAIDDGADTTILHVSDIHSNPLGVEIAGQLATSFDVDAVLDTGDLTSFGLPLEARIGDLIAGVGRPWYFVAGNHDSATVRASLAAVPNIVPIDSTVVDVAGVRVLGVPDPTFTASNETSTADANAAKLDAAARVAAAVRASAPDLLAVHDLRQAADVAGSVPVVVGGHVHETTSAVRDGTRFLTIGSTGATGLGSFAVEADLAYEAELLRFDGGVLVAIDRVRVDGLSGAFTIDREVLEPPEPDGD
jgi:predicted phosphodiesterase